MMKLRILLAVVTFAASTRAEAATRTVGLKAQAAPGPPAGAMFSDLFYTGADYLAPPINATGKTAFAAALTAGAGGVTTGNDTGIWSEGSGSLALVVREGDPAPGLAGPVVQRAINPVLNSAGKVAFDGLITGPGVNASNNEVIWSTGNGALAMAAREGSAAPGTGAGVVFFSLIDPALSDSGQVAFRALLLGTGVTTANNRGIWSQKAGVLGLVARFGDQAAGTPAGVVFSAFPASKPMINVANNVGFRAQLTGTGVAAANDWGIWVERDGSLKLVAREGDAATPAGAGVNFLSLGDPSMNRDGDTAFSSTLTGAGVNATNDYSLWAEKSGALQLAAREGQTAQGAVKFLDFGSAMLNARGDLAFIGKTVGWGGTANTRGGLWAKPVDGAWRMVATDSAQFSNLPAGVFHSTFAVPVLNNNGQLAFASTLTGTGVTTANDIAIWVETVTKELKLVAREGDMLQVSPGVNRTISTLAFAGGFNTEQGYRTGLNDRGEVSFMATFTDGTSGVFVYDIGMPTSDFNGDGAVDGSDFLVWQRNLGATGTGTRATGDATGDTNVNAADLTVWRTETAGAGGSVSAVPEPACVCMAALALAALVASKRRAA